MSNEAENPKTRSVSPEGGVKFIYANNVEVGHTVYDVRVLFGEILGNKDGFVEIEQRVHVTMGWLQAKILAHLLTAVVASYEKLNGPLNAPNVNMKSLLRELNIGREEEG